MNSKGKIQNSKWIGCFSLILLVNICGSGNRSSAQEFKIPLDTLVQAYDTSFVMGEITSPLWQAGLYAGASPTFFSADMQGLPGIPSCCPTYSGGNGFGLFAGLLFDYPLSTDLQVGTRLGLELTSGEFKTEEIQFLDNGVGGVEGQIEHLITSELIRINVEPGITYQIISGLRGRVGVGVTLFAKGTFQQHERLLAPGNVRFENNQRERMTFDGNIPELNSVGLSFTPSLHYTLPMNRQGSLLLTPELGGRVGSTEIVPGTSWKSNEIHLGIGLRYQKLQTEEAIVDTILTPRPVDSVEIRLRQPVINILTFEDGAERILDTLQLEIVRTTSLVPLLPHIFFDEESADIPDRYNRISTAETATFSETEINGEAFDVYYQSLNVIGERMRRYPETTIILTGCNADVGTEKNNVELSRRRAESVRFYLTETWGISQDRIGIVARNLPTNPSPSRNEDGRAENRRVEFTSDDPRIVYPVTTGDSTMRPDKSVVWFDIDADERTASWSVVATQGSRVILQEEGNGLPPSRIPLALTSGASTVELGDENIRFTVTLNDRNGRKSEQGGAIRVWREQRIRPGAESYWMVVFGYNSRRLGEEGRQTIEAIQKWNREREGYVAELVGQTDRTGNADYNRKLSEDRAATVATELGEGTEKMRGVGNALLEYPNDLPEGRYYSRNVKVVTRTDRED
ncbi:MAG: OmpA family protein [Ignavibacteriae bacterium]|nr:OmpA family protein [Ignavibacteriota bacterium]MCB9216805.1 OmpA family protein [Ignavibacteria bacterium]